MPRIQPSDLIRGVVIIEPELHGDARGRFVETYRREWIDKGSEMVQANRSDKQAGAVVGLHYHLHQADYWTVVSGTARVVLHDLRRYSPSEGATLVLDINGEQAQGVYIPPGVAHGFAALTDLTLTYLVDHYYDVADELGVLWDDPAIAANWGVVSPVLSARDQANPRLAELSAEALPVWSTSR